MAQGSNLGGMKEVATISNRTGLSTRKFIDLVNLTLILLSAFTAIYILDFLALLACTLLFSAHFLRRCPSLYYLSLVFNIYYTFRYTCLQLLETRFIFDDKSLQPHLGAAFLECSAFYFIISITLNFFSNTSNNLPRQKEKDLDFFITFAKISIVAFAIVALSGSYSIGREIDSIIARLITRISLFLSYFDFYILYIPSAPFYLILFSTTQIIFGSKAFIYSIVIWILYYQIIEDRKILYRYLIVILILILISIQVSNSINDYRITNTIDPANFLIKENFSLFDNIKVIVDAVGIRFAGLDTYTAHSVIEPMYSMISIAYEVIVSINNFLFLIKIPLPYDFISSEYRTALIFKSSHFYDHIGSLRHTDSMFGLARFIAIEHGGGYLLFIISLFAPIVAFRGYGTNFGVVMRMFYFNEIIIGGTYHTIFRVFIEISILYFILLICLPYWRKMNFRKSAKRAPKSD